MIVPKILLTFQEMKQCSVEINTIVFIDENYNVLFGNSYQSYLSDSVECIMIPENYAQYLRKWMKDFEDYIVEENNLKRFHDMEIQLKKLLRDDNDDSLFEIEKETRTIEDVEFDAPTNFKFKKGKKKKGEEDDNLFSCFGI